MKILPVLLPPRDGEVFDTIEAGEIRLLGHSLAAGYQTVRGQGSKGGRQNIWCIHHGLKTRNDRDLSLRVEKDAAGKIISTRRRDDTRAWAKDCKWRGFLTPFTEIDNDGAKINRFVWRYGRSQADSLPTDQHTHAFNENPLIYPKHKSAQVDFVEAVPQAIAMRASHLPFRQAERILHGQGLKIDRNWYYNLARMNAMETSPDGLLALVTVLEKDNWTYRTFWEFIKDDLNVVTKRVLKAVFFTNDRLIKQARRFTPDWMIQVDGTFNTNKIRMPLIDCLGVSNCGKSFIFAFAFVTSESRDNWGFILQCLEQTVFNGLPLPRVVIADQGLGLRSVFESVWPACLLQFCEWHAADNIKRRLAVKRYKKEEREDIMRLVWRYIQSATELDLEINRTAMKDAMKVDEQKYIDTHWRPKEKQVIRCYTTWNPNLNCFSSQREEGKHPMIKTVLNHRLRLDIAVQRLDEEMIHELETLQEAEQNDRGHGYRLLEANVWYLVKEVIASWPLKVMEREWDQLDRLRAVNAPLPPCYCALVERFGLPCLHYLERAWNEHLPIPLTLIHSRWWYRGGIEARSGWRPTYGDQVQSEPQRIVLERPRLEIIEATNKLLTFRETLTREEQELLDADQVRSTTQILLDARTRQHINTIIPRTLPDPIPKPTWNRYVKTHDKAKKRMMTGAEAAVKDANTVEAVEKKRQQEKEKESAIDDEMLAGAASEKEDDSDHSSVREVVFSTPISPPRGTMLPPARPTTPETEVARKRSFTLVHRTPEKPREAPVAPTTPLNTFTREASPVAATPPTPAEIPASTVPARLDGRTRREGKNARYNEAMTIERGRGGRGQGGKA
jgi:MULE transposase domain